MSSIKEIAVLTGKVIIGLAVASVILGFLGINLFSLISAPVATVKGLVTPAK